MESYSWTNIYFICINSFYEGNWVILEYNGSEGAGQNDLVIFDLIWWDACLVNAYFFMNSLKQKKFE